MGACLTVSIRVKKTYQTNEVNRETAQKFMKISLRPYI